MFIFNLLVLVLCIPVPSGPLSLEVWLHVPTVVSNTSKSFSFCSPSVGGVIFFGWPEPVAFRRVYGT